MEESRTPSLFEGIHQGGPYVVLLHLLMLVGFCVSLLLSFRRTGSITALACSFTPFVCGATATWLGIVGLLSVISGFMYEGDTPATLRLLQRPFLIGSGLSVVALIVYFLTRALNSKARNV